MNTISARSIVFLSVMFSVLLLSSCDDTRLVRSWTAPKATTGEMKKLVAFVMTPSASTRRNAEQEMVSELRQRGINAVPSFEVLGDSDLRSVQAAKGKLAVAGFDGALILRPLGTETEIKYTGGVFPPHYSTFWGYYGWGWPYIYDPGHITTTTVRRIEGMAYSIEQDRLLWAGLLENRNGSDLEEVVQSVTENIAERIRENEILARAGL